MERKGIRTVPKVGAGVEVAVGLDVSAGAEVGEGSGVDEVEFGSFELSPQAASVSSREGS